MNNYINRNIENKIIEISENFPVIMITGPRQVGKSTLLNYLSNKLNVTKYVSLDNMKDRTLAKEDPELFLETLGTPAIIDEFQYVPELLSYIKINVDKKRLTNDKANGNYFLTGSQSFLSMKNITESLAGRVGIIELYGLSTREIQKRNSNLFIPNIVDLKKQNNSLEKQNIDDIFTRIYKGSFPELYKQQNISLEMYFESYVKTYIERDIRDLINVKDEIKFMKFITSIAARTGQELNLAEVSNDAEVSNPTANEWLSILLNTGLIILIEPYTKNIIKRVVKRPKIYFMDTGLACYLTKYPSAKIVESSAFAGPIFETYVVSEIVKSFSNNLLKPNRHLYYYRDNNNHEIDLIIEYNNVLYPIEIKKGKNPGKEATKNFYVLNDTNMAISNGVVLCTTDEIYPLDRNNYLVPIDYI